MIEKSLDASLLFGIIDLTSQIRLRGDLIYKFAGLTTPQYVILLYLAHDPNISSNRSNDTTEGIYASELATLLKISRPGVTNLLKVLIKKDLVRQSEDEKDRRKKPLLLTDKGIVLVQDMEPLRQDVNAAFLSGFSAAEKEQFLAFIERCSSYANDQLANPEALIRKHKKT